MIKWERATAEEMKIAGKIAKRACKMADDAGVEYDRQTAQMDIVACHLSCPLKLNELLAADNGNFGHDVFGIRRHLNRETGELMNCFLPRFAR